MLQDSVAASELVYQKAPSGDNPYAAIIDAVRDCLDAADRGDDSQWRLADLLVELVGPSGRNGAHNRSNTLLGKIAAQIKKALGKRARGFGFENLRRLRDTASIFPPGHRLPGVSVTVHGLAPDLETLTAAAKEAQKQKRELTTGFFREFVARRDANDIPELITAKEELRRTAAQFAGQARSMNDLLRKQPDLSAKDVETLNAAFVEVVGKIDNGNKLIADAKRLLQRKAT